jgi:hypothetical protein
VAIACPSSGRIAAIVCSHRIPAILVAAAILIAVRS